MIRTLEHKAKLLETVEEVLKTLGGPGSGNFGHGGGAGKKGDTAKAATDRAHEQPSYSTHTAAARAHKEAAVAFGRDTQKGRYHGSASKSHEMIAKSMK